MIRYVKMRGLVRNLIKSCRRSGKCGDDGVCSETLFSLNEFEINFHRRQEIIRRVLIAPRRREELALSSWWIMQTFQSHLHSYSYNNKIALVRSLALEKKDERKRGKLHFQKKRELVVRYAEEPCSLKVAGKIEFRDQLKKFWATWIKMQMERN
jgi:hypothetical protein